MVWTISVCLYVTVNQVVICHRCIPGQRDEAYGNIMFLVRSRRNTNIQVCVLITYYKNNWQYFLQHISTLFKSGIEVFVTLSGYGIV